MNYPVVDTPNFVYFAYFAWMLMDLRIGYNMSNSTSKIRWREIQNYKRNRGGINYFSELVNSFEHTLYFLNL